MGQVRISLDKITEEALALVDSEGFAGLTLSKVAKRLDVGPSALYSHLDGLEGLRYAVAVASTQNLLDDVRNAAIGTSGDTALAAIGAAYRRFAQNNPGQFASTLLPPTGQGNDDFADATQSLLDVFTLVFEAMGLSAESSNLAARSTRSAIHGFLALEHTSGTSPAHDAEYQYLLDTLNNGRS